MRFPGVRQTLAIAMNVSIADALSNRNPDKNELFLHKIGI
jgi:hypothetical protein